MKKMLSALTLVTASALSLGGCSAAPATSPSASGSAAPSAAPQNITLWLAGGDTPDALREYLKTAYKAKTGGTLTIEEQAWGDLVTKLTTALPDAEEHPRRRRGRQHPVAHLHQRRRVPRHLRHVQRTRRRQAAAVVRRGRQGRREELHPAVLLRLALHVLPQGHLDAAAGVAGAEDPGGVQRHGEDHRREEPKNIKDFSGFFIGGQDWRNGISWVFANGGELAKVDRTAPWTSTLSDPNTIKGLTQLQEIQKYASNAPSTAKDESPWLYINDADVIKDNADNPTR